MHNKTKECIPSSVCSLIVYRWKSLASSGFAIPHAILYGDLMALYCQESLSSISLTSPELRMVISLNKPISILRRACVSNHLKMLKKQRWMSEPQPGQTCATEETGRKEGRRGWPGGPSLLLSRSSTTELNFCKGNGALAKLAIYTNWDWPWHNSPMPPEATPCWFMSGSCLNNL